MAGRGRWEREHILQGGPNRPRLLSRIELKAGEQALTLEALQFEGAQRPRRYAVPVALHCDQCSWWLPGKRRDRTRRLSWAHPSTNGLRFIQLISKRDRKRAISG